MYNEHFQPPKVPWRDDETGEPLVRRPDDERGELCFPGLFCALCDVSLPATVERRLDTFESATRPVLNFFATTLPSAFHTVQCETSPLGYAKIKPIVERIAHQRS